MRECSLFRHATDTPAPCTANCVLIPSISSQSVGPASDDGEARDHGHKLRRLDGGETQLLNACRQTPLFVDHRVVAW